LIVIRFAVRAEVQHRTEPFEAAFSWFRGKVDPITNSPVSTIRAICAALIAAIVLKALFRPPIPLPVPDILRATLVARTFEPLIYYSEGGMRQISEIQDTGFAVWDLGESVRSTNMTSGPIIVKELDELSTSLVTLAEQLGRFFVHVDGDIDRFVFPLSLSLKFVLTPNAASSA
jgi:hypothetical protein